MKTEARVIQQSGKVGIRKVVLKSDGTAVCASSEHISPEFTSVADLESWLEDVVTSLQRPVIKLQDSVPVGATPLGTLGRVMAGVAGKAKPNGRARRVAAADSSGGLFTRSRRSASIPSELDL